MYYNYLPPKPDICVNLSHWHTLFFTELVQDAAEQKQVPSPSNFSHKSADGGTTTSNLELTADDDLANLEDIDQEELQGNIGYLFALSL